MPLIIGGSVAAPILGGIVGNIASQGDVDAAKQAQQAALQNILGIKVPNLQDINYAQYAPAQTVNPVLEQTINAPDSLMQGVSVDPTLRAAQMSALSRLQQLGAGGLQPQDIAALTAATQQANAAAAAQNASTLQAMQQRGQAGSGAELAARLAAGQNAANQQMSAGLNIQGQAAQRALEALAQSGSLGAQMEGQQFGEASQRAQAQDLVNRFNAMNAQQIAGQNVGAQNQAQYYNVGNQNALNQANTQLVNQARYQNQVANPMNQYNMNLQKGEVASGAYNNMANQQMQNAGRTQQMFSGMGTGVGQGLGAYAGYQAQQDATDAYKQRTAAMYPNTKPIQELVPNYTDNNFKMPTTPNGG